ncbi:MAG: type II toxin-antitoxin system HicA family toxin, partial [Rhizobiaceae bacterium]|nr:type II toxin-antitoxin system HicA family toxin [Rhizobiaceae bacterium]
MYYTESDPFSGEKLFVEKDAGGGSRRKFVHSSTKQIIRLHEPHPGNEMKPYMVRQIRDQLIDQGLI